jgi:hypothetical protein
MVLVEAQLILDLLRRNALDELFAAATVQLLQRQGIAAETAGYEQFARRRAGEIEVGASTTICVVSLDAGQTTAYLRILLRRLHQRAPLAALVLGFTSGSEEDTEESRGTPAFAAPTFGELIAHLLPGDRTIEPSECLQSTDGGKGVTGPTWQYQAGAPLQ